MFRFQIYNKFRLKPIFRVTIFRFRRNFTYHPIFSVRYDIFYILIFNFFVLYLSIIYKIYIMKRLSSLWLSVLVFGATTACTSDFEDNAVPSDSTAAAVESSSTVRPLDEALADLDAFFDDLNATTRSSRTYNIKEVGVVGGSAATRADGTPSLPDTLAYVVNFTGNKGFAVLGAQKTSTPIYAVTESGSLSSSRLNKTILSIAEDEKRIAGMTPEQIESIFGKPVDWGADEEIDDDDFVDFGKDAVYRFVGTAVYNNGRKLADSNLTASDADLPNSAYDDTSGKGIDNSYLDDYEPMGTVVSSRPGRKYWKVLSQRVPMLKTEWHQGVPFNNLCPKKEGSTYSNGRAPAGCQVIAIGQICAYHRRPATPIFDGFECKWDTIMKWETGEIENTAAIHLSYLCYGLGKSEYNDVKYSATGSTATTKRAKKALQKCGFNNVEIKRKFNSKKKAILYSMLDNNKPVFFRGDGYFYNNTTNQYDKGGHAIVIDGYINRQWIEESVCTYSSGATKTYTTMTEQHLVHCNWGWGVDNGNGYYHMDIFNTEEEVDYETGGNIGEEQGSRLTSEFNFITYDL